MRVISIINLKGGVGKTMTAVQMAYLLNQRGNSVLLIDNDKQGNSSKLFETYQGNDTCDTARLLLGDYEDIEDLIEYTNYPNLNIISANMTLLSATWQLNKEDKSDQLTRYQKIRQLDYDYVIIDNPPDLGLNVLNALMTTNDVIVPTKIDEWSLEGLEIIESQLKELKQLNPDINYMGALVTMYQKDFVNLSGLEWLQEKRHKTFETCIRFSKKAAESTFFGKPVAEYSPRSGTARSYKAFINEYLLKMEVM